MLPTSFGQCPSTFMAEKGSAFRGHIQTFADHTHTHTPAMITHEYSKSGTKGKNMPNKPMYLATRAWMLCRRQNSKNHFGKMSLCPSPHDLHFWVLSTTYLACNPMLSPAPPSMQEGCMEKSYQNGQI